MKKGFYSKLAWTGIRKNKKLYTPYILTCIGMVMMFYIVSFLSISDILNSMPGGDTMQMMLGFGCGVIGVFALIFLFYTNSFLVRRRKKEFGLYNILGMGKWNLARVLLWESLIIAGISLAIGLFFGIVFSKFAELAMINILSAEITFSLTIAPQAIIQTLALFAGIFLLILLNTLRQIHLTNPIELLHSENVGEKPPKANWFFVAVIMVIVATYLLFISGSVAVCRILQKKKNYYYKANHFVSVSSMAYRMKRNGAGLASICILCTMVLVMVSSTVCLYIGTEDSLRAYYPRNICLDTQASKISTIASETTDRIRELSDQVLLENGQEGKNTLDYRVAEFPGYISDGVVQTDQSSVPTFQLSAYSDVWQVFVISLDDYNRLMGQQETLRDDEVLIYTTIENGYTEETIAIDDAKPMKVKKAVTHFTDNGIDAVETVPSLYIFVPDFEQYLAPLMDATDDNGNPAIELHWFYGFDLECDDEIQIQIYRQIQNGLGQLSFSSEDDSFVIQCESVANERQVFYGLYGGLFFLGILLGVVFIFAAVLIIYYKQISEGYEDQSRFEIMQKVGMTQKDIRKSINSQVLTVFFLPLIAAGIHLCFAFPLISKLLTLFNLTNLYLLILTTIACYLIFTLFYMLVYKITSKAYYSIVSGIGKEAV